MAESNIELDSVGRSQLSEAGAQDSDTDFYSSEDDLLTATLTDKSQITPNLHSNVYTIKYKIFRTVFIVLGHMALGLYLELTGPTLKELMLRTDSDYEEMGRALMTRSIGYLISSLASGILTDIFSRYVEVILGVAYLLGCIGTILTPCAASLPQLACLNLVQGLGMGASDVCQNLLILRIWAAKAAAPINSLHMGFGIGAFISPQLVKPFLVPDNVVTSIISNGSNSNISDLLPINVTINATFTRPRSRIEVPYSIAALIVLIVGILNFSIHVYEKKKYRIQLFSPGKLTPTGNIGGSLLKKIKDGLNMFSPGACTGGHAKFGSFFFFFIFIYFSNVVGSERAISRFLFSFSQETNVSFSNHNAANLNSVFWFSFLGGRFLAIFAALLLSAKLFIFTLLCILLVSSALLVAYGSSDPLMLWVGSGIYGVSVAPLFPACAGWANLYVEMKGLAVSVMTVGAATGAMIFQYVTGYLFEYRGPEMVMQILLASGVIITATYISLSIVAEKHGERFQVIKK